MSVSDEAISRLEQSRLKMSMAMNAPEASSSAASLALATGNLMLKPTVQNHPLTAAIAAAVLGALIIKTRPWRLMSNPIILSALAPLAIAKIGLLAPSAEPALLRGFELYRQFLQSRSIPKGK
jgi:hypothetical protein